MKSSFVDHYLVLGLPTGEEGMNLAERDIIKAYKSKALQVHPDKRPPEEVEEAHREFQRLTDSYELLLDTRKRQDFHALLCSRHSIREVSVPCAEGDEKWAGISESAARNCRDRGDEKMAELFESIARKEREAKAHLEEIKRKGMAKVLRRRKAGEGARL